MASTITAGNATNGLALSCDNTGILELKTGTGAGTTAVTLDASQNATFAGTITAANGVTGDFKMNSGYGSVATVYGCRAWVNFNGTGTPAIRASGNVSSITDNGVGNYTVNFTTAMPDANYNFVVSAERGAGQNMIINKTNGGTQTTSALQIEANDQTNTSRDPVTVCISIFR
jgi:hypothetical protein